LKISCRQISGDGRLNNKINLIPKTKARVCCSCDSWGTTHKSEFLIRGNVCNEEVSRKGRKDNSQSAQRFSAAFAGLSFTGLA
jgi:hypothetical protein